MQDGSYPPAGGQPVGTYPPAGGQPVGSYPPPDGQPVGQHTTVVVQQRDPKPPNFLVLAIFTTICCNLPLGIVAIILSVLSDNAYGDGDMEGARKKGKISMILSIIGILLTLIIIIIIIIYVFVIAKAAVDTLQNTYGNNFQNNFT